MSGNYVRQTNPDEYISHPSKQKGPFLHPNDAIKGKMFHFDVRFLFKSRISAELLTYRQTDLQHLEKAVRLF